MTNAVKEAAFVQMLHTEVEENRNPAWICEDNTGAISLTNNSQVDAGNKHINVQYQHLHDSIRWQYTCHVC